MAIQQIGDGRPDGSTLGASASELVGVHGKAVAQYSNIALVSTGGITSLGITALVDLMIAQGNSLVASQTLFGTVAAS